MIEKRRILISVVNIVLVLLVPYWIYLPALFISVIMLPLYWEGVVLAVLVDILYGRGGSFFETHFLGIIVLILVLILIPLRERFRL